MADYLDLVNVQFVDNTVNVNIDNQDIMGCLFDYHWGPANQLLVLDKNAFYQYYPMSIPVGASKVDVSKYTGYAQIKKAFDSGISRVEVIRVCKTGKWKYQHFRILSTGTLDATPTLSDTQFGTASNTVPVVIALKYPGFVPQSLLDGYANIGLKVSYTPSTNIISIEVCGIYTQNGNTVFSPIESYEGSLNPMATQDGLNIYICNLVANSQFISVYVNPDASLPAATISSQQRSFSVFNYASTSSYYLDPENSDEDNQLIKDTLEKYYNDFDLSSCTLLISPYCFAPKAPIENFDNTIINIAARRKNLNAIVGYPITGEFSESAILIYYHTLDRDKFSDFVAAREYVYLWGNAITINGTGGYCGRLAKIAKDVRLNQLPSARTYGQYSGVLAASLQFGDVLTLHEQGIISIYNTKTGIQIFGVRSMYTRQSSYFGKANVMRVIAALLRNIFPIALDAIHTDVAANPISMLTMQTTLQAVMNDFIANQNLRPQSRVVCDGTVNTDYTTRQGTVFNIVLECWFIGLTERINIKVVATDSTVTAEITE